MDTQECAVEEMKEEFGIFRFSLSDGCYTYLIPIRHEEIIEWVKLNINSPYKILKRTSVVFISTNENLKWQRDRSKEFTERWKQELFIRQNTRTILIEKNENRPNKKHQNQFKKFL